ncbi:MAG TPA: protein kinase [Polyangiaceae bacterium]|nr:protein kinase [Polyangiaceae bacterium]
MPTTERDLKGRVSEGAGLRRTPVDHSSRRLHTSEIDDLVEAAFSERVPVDRASREPPLPDPYVGVEVDRRYVIESLIAAGGMGLVYRCRHRVLGKKLAIKIIRSDVAHMPDGSERFMLEAKAASSIGNEHIVDIGDFGAMPDGSPYLVMEYLEGISLAALLRKHPRLAVSRIAGIASQIAEGLGAAHAAGIVHRDLKPDNVFVLDRKGEDFVKVLDFGVARMAQSAKKLTQAGTIVGTPHYMSPEQALGLEVDHRGDIYSLGIILYELIAGRVPFDGDHYVAVLHQHLQTTPPPFDSVEPPLEIPLALERIVGKCLAKAPEDRYATMQELAHELAPFREKRLLLLGPGADDEPLLPAPSLPPALPAASLARAANFQQPTARLPEPSFEMPSLPSAVEAPRADELAEPHQPTLALPRLTGNFVSVPQKRFVTSLSVIVLIGVCAVAAFRFGTAPSSKPHRTPNVPLPAEPSAPTPDPTAAPAALRGELPAAAARDPAAPAEPAAPLPAPSEPSALDAPPASADPTSAASAETSRPSAEQPARGTPDPARANAGKSASTRERPAPPAATPARERREPSSGRRRPASNKAKPREEFMNPWPAPRR